MPYERVAGNNQILSANGGADGFATFASNVGYFPGAVAYISDSTPGNSQRCRITELSGTDKVGLRYEPEDPNDPKLRDGTIPAWPSFGRSDLSAFTTANSARLTMSAQVAQVQQPRFDPAPDATGQA